MNFATLLPLLSAICVFVLGVFVLFRNFRAAINYTFFLVCLGITVWMFGTFMMFLNVDNYAAAAFWDRIVYCGVVFIPATMLHFSLVTMTNRRFNERWWLLVAAYAITFIFLPLIFTDQFVAGVFVYQWGIHTQAQILHHVFLVYFTVYLTYFFIVVGKYYRQAIGIEKLQIRYIIIAFVILAIFGSLGYLPAYGVSIYPFSYLSGVVFVLIIAYATLRYRLMDMRVVGRNMAIYFFDALFVTAFYFFIIMAYPRLLQVDFGRYMIYSGLFISPIFAVLFIQYHKWITEFIDRHFFYSLYDYQKTITNLSDQLTHYSDLNKIVDLIVDKILATMNLDRAGVLLAAKTEAGTHYKIAKVTGFDITNGISLVKDNFLTQYLKKTAKPLVREELSRLADNSARPQDAAAFRNLEKEMIHIEASLCLPLLSGQGLCGIIVLGYKKNNDPYTKEDLNLLATLSNQAAIAIDNARMYQEMKNFNKLLQQKVDQQTKDIKAKAEHLQKLLKMREEFLDIASHQLKTPISVIRGTLSMFREGSMDHLPKEEQRKFMDNIYHKTEKLNVIISDILRASEIDSEEFKIDPAKAQAIKVDEAIKDIYGDLKELADEKGIKLILKLPAKPVPPILTSADFFEQAIFNLVDNAIKYTSQGSVTIDLSGNDKEIVIKVSDTGIGVPEADKKKIFDKFSRAKNAVNMYADGSGLGLYIVKRVVEAHPGGTIVMDSQENVGTTFTVKLKPLSGKAPAAQLSNRQPASSQAAAAIDAAKPETAAKNVRKAFKSAVLGREAKIIKSAAADSRTGLKKKRKSGKVAKDKLRK